MSSSAITGPILSDVRRAPAGTAAAPSFAFNDSTGTGVYLVSPGVLGLSTAGVQRVVVTADGNLLVGTATDSGYRATFGVPSSVGGTTGNAILLRNPGRGGANIAGINDNNLVLTQIDFTSEDKGVNTFDDGIIRFSTRYDAVAGGALTERMRIDSSGNLLVGTASVVGTSGGGKISAVSTTPPLGLRCTATAAGKLWNVGPDSGNAFTVYNQASNGAYLPDGGTSWQANSDERLKKNIKSLELGLEQIKALKPARFDYNQDESESSARVGFIAQEVLPVLPHAVHVPEDSEQMMGVSATEMIPVLVKAIQELEARLAALESK